MWSCDRINLKSSGPIVHVLNGDYPEADVKRMSLNGLEKFVSRLVQCTAEVVGAKSATNKPKWWPNGIVFSHPINLGLDSEHEIKLTLKQLIANCSQFFKNYSLERTKWSDGWNDENRRGSKRMRSEKITSAPNRKRYKAFVQLPPKAFEPFIPLEDRQEIPPINAPTKNQFLYYFKLNSKRCNKIGPAIKPPIAMGAAKLTTCINIPFSSDVGRIMAAREQHQMPDDLKLKRLERSEWYTNKTTSKTGDVAYESTSTYSKEPHHTHSYKIPKRQQHHKRHSLHNAEFLAQFCTPLYVTLHRLDLDKVKSDRNESKKELVVMIGNSEKQSCDGKKEAKIVRTSPRLRNV